MNKIKFRIIVIGLFLTLFVRNGYCQENQKNLDLTTKMPLSPEAFSLFKFTEIPVSNTTGIPNITIPIHTIKLKDFELPISLDYHSSGIRIDEIASSVGLGWALNAGGMITSQVFGLPDLLNNREYVEPQNRRLDQFANFSGSCGLSNNMDYNFINDYYISSYRMDTQPDIFYYKYGNSSGKFFIANDGTINTMPQVPIKIIRETNYKFIIIDENGNKYIYDVEGLDRSSSATFSPYPIFEGGSNISESPSFYLSKIETINNEVINFNYINQYYEYRLPNNYSRYKRHPIINTDSQLPIFAESETQTIMSTYGKVLKTITTNTSENIEFIYENCPRLDTPSTNISNGNIPLTGGFALNGIIVKNGNTSIASYTLKQDYFNLNNYEPCVTQSTGSNRLKLVSVKKNGENPYLFEYNQNTELPDRLGDSFDHWGFLKSYGSKYSLDYEYNFYDGLDREPELEYTKLGVLNKIVYPTGGYSVFEYELNQYYGVKNNLVINPPILKQEGLYLYGPQIGNTLIDPQYLSLDIIIPTDIISGSLFVTITKPDVVYQDDSNWMSYNITNRDTNQLIDWGSVYNPITNELYLLGGNYRLELSGVFVGGGISVRWHERNIENIQNIGTFNTGGLRVKNIKTFDNQINNTLLLRKSYKYFKFDEISHSSGKIISDPKYSYFIEKNDVHCWSDPICTFPGGPTLLHKTSVLYHSQNSRNILPLNGMQGYHIMYTDVRILEDENSTNGFVDYKYSFAEDDFSYFNIKNTPATSYDFKRGNLIEQTFYKKSSINADFIKVRDIKYDYKYNFTEADSNQFFSNALMPNEKHGFGFQINFLNIETNCSKSSAQCQQLQTEVEIGYYKLYSIWKYLKKTTESTFDINGQNPITTTTNYFYDNPEHLQLTRTEVATSDGKQVQTRTMYPDDVTSTTYLGLDALTVDEKAAIDQLKKGVQHRISEPIQVATQVKDLVGTVLSENTQRTNYKDWNGLVLPESIKTLKGTFNESTNPSETRIRFLSYYPNGNVKEVSKEDGTPIVYLWGYQQTQPIAKIENATYAQVQSAIAVSPYFTTVEAIQLKSDLDNDRTVGTTGSEGILRTALASLRSSLLNSQVTTYTYDPLIGVTSITDPSGYTVYYVYDTFNRLQYIKNKEGEVIEQYRYNYKKEALLASTSSSSSSVNAGQSVTFTTSATGGSGSFTYKWTVSNASLNQVYTNTTGVLTLTTGSSHAPNFTAVCEVTDTQTQEVVTTTTQIAVSVGYATLSVGYISEYPSGSIWVGDYKIYTIDVTGGSGNYGYVWSKTNNQSHYPLSSTVNNVGVDVTVYDCYFYTITCVVTDLTTNESVTRWQDYYVSSGCREGEVEQ